ncbi:MAG: hypothetical protein U0802_15740 [Candidatus Binatia bacterium]
MIAETDYDGYLFQDADDWSAHDRLALLLRAAARRGADLVGCQEGRWHADGWKTCCLPHRRQPRARRGAGARAAAPHQPGVARLRAVRAAPGLRFFNGNRVPLAGASPGHGRQHPVPPLRAPTGAPRIVDRRPNTGHGSPARVRIKDECKRRFWRTRDALRRGESRGQHPQRAAGRPPARRRAAAAVVRSDAGRQVVRDFSTTIGDQPRAAASPRKLKVGALTSWTHHREWLGTVRRDPARPRLGERRRRAAGRFGRAPGAQSIVLDEPWVGFVHKAPLARSISARSAWRDASLAAMMASDVWRRNIERCRGRSVSPSTCAPTCSRALSAPVDAVALPTSFDCPRFDFAAFRRNQDKRVLFIGHWLRRFPVLLRPRRAPAFASCC